jgi:hypothetical protein
MLKVGDVVVSMEVRGVSVGNDEEMRSWRDEVATNSSLLRSTI